MSKTRTMLTIDEQVLRALKVRAARTGKGDSEVIKEAVRPGINRQQRQGLWQEGPR
ncbi:MAG: ribbon-helix-helix protein, CopG family [Acidimicrobiales bacterium]